MKLNKITKTTIFLAILLVSFLLPIVAFGQSSGGTQTRVNWDVINETFTDNWTWEDSSWEFGPQAQFRIEYLNGTEIDGDNEYIEINEEFVVRGSIPDAIFQGRDNRSLGAVDVHWNLQIWDDEDSQGNPGSFMGMPLIEANLNLVYYAVHPSEIWDWYYLPPGEEIIYEEGWEWEVNTWQQNNTMGEGFAGSKSSNEADEYEYKSLPSRLKMAAEEPDVAQNYEEPEPFYTINWDESEAIYDGSTDTWNIKWTGKFNERVYLGTYRVEMGVYSNVGERINMWGFSSWESGETPEKWIGVGELAVFNMWWGYSQWGLKTLDSVGRETKTVGTEELLTFRFNISENIEPGFVYAVMNLPNWYKETTDEVGWHDEAVSQTGGWVYDGNVGTYLYNPNASFSTRQYVYGAYEQEVWVDNWQQANVLVNHSGWDWSTGDPVWMDWGEQSWQKQLFLIYNQTTGAFSVKIGYERWVENPIDPYSGGRREFVLNDVNMSNPIEDFFRLSSTNKYEDAEERTIVEFTGYFTDFIGSSENRFGYHAGVIDVYGNEHNTDMAWGEIGVNQPQVNSWIVDDSGGKWDKPFFNMNPGEAFIIRNELLGANEFWNSIDGVRFRIDCWDSQWNNETEIWSNIEIFATYNLESGVTTFEAYNQTNKRVWENSTHEDWVRVEKVGFHWEYDESLGYDVWVNGTYEDWDWVELTDWHWQDYQFNQETDEWIKGWLPWHGPETDISSEIDFLNINSVSQYTNSEGSFLDLSVTISEGAPEASYNWEVEFLKLEWGYDNSKPWGQYDTYQWIRKDVYYYEDNGMKNYVPDPEIRDYVTINDSRYLIEEMPYVVIAGQVRPIKVSTYLDWSNQLQESIMFQDWDWQTGQEYFYYIDANTNTKIIFQEGEKALVYTVTLNDTGITDTFQTMMNSPSQYYDNALYEQVYYFVDLNGTLHYLSAYTEWNETGGDLMSDRWNPANTWLADNTHLRTIDSIDYIILSAEVRSEENRVFFVVLDGTTRFELFSNGIQYFNGQLYIIGTNGVKYDITTIAWNEQYGTDMTVNIDGIEYYISDAMEAYRVNYGDTEILVPRYYNGYHNNWNEILGRYYYTIEGGVVSILPYAGANVNNRWQMEGTVTGLSRGAGKHFGVVPVLRFVDINGTLYLMSNLTFANQQMTSGDIVLDGEPTHLTIQKSMVTTVNGTLNFNLTSVGELVPYGVFYRNFPFEENGTLQVMEGQKIFNEGNHHGYLQNYGLDNFYRNNGSFYLNLTDGSKINVRRSFSIPIFNVTVKTGNNQIWMKDLLSLSEWEHWNNSQKFLPLLNGTSLDLPINSWIEVIDEYSAALNFNNTNVYLIGGVPYNWSEPDFNSQDASSNFIFNGTTYSFKNFTYIDDQGNPNSFLQHNMMRILEAEVEPGTWKTLKDPNYDWYSKEPMGWNKFFNLTVGTEIYFLQKEKNFINFYQTIWGHPYGLFFERQEVLSVKTPWNLIFGTPRNNMWGYRFFTTTDEGALDLDGDLTTTDDQYYVFRTYESHDTFSHTRNILELEIDYDPITNVGGNNMWMWSSMGINTMTWTYEWSEEYTWFKADGTFSKLNSTEMDEIVNIVLDENGFERPGYWEIGRMVKNRTWEDVLAEAEKYNWDWVLDNTHEWTWIEFNIDQNYWADFYADSSMEEIKSALVTNRYEYSGLMLYNDSDNDGFMDIGLNSEITHFFVPSSVEDVSFTFPDVSNVSSHIETREYWDWDGPYTKEVEVFTFVGAADVDWGVKFSTINGTTYPYDDDNRRSMWDWYDGVVDGEDFRGFKNKPVEVTIDKLDFMVHFNGNTTADGLNFVTEMKIDQWVGDWMPDITGGRDNLENYSLSLTYYVLTGAASMSYEGKGEEPEDPNDPGGGAQILDENNQTLSIDNQTISETFSMVLDDADESFAKVELGSPYTWSFDTTKELKVSVFTTPISTFSGAFMSDSDQSLTSFAFDAELYFMSVGFSKWDGYEVYNDPVFTAYVGASSHGDFGSGPIIQFIVIPVGIGAVIIAVVVVVLKKRKK